MEGVCVCGGGELEVLALRTEQQQQQKKKTKKAQNYK